jgi:predicted DCC family thiol-disulfide oxidoreductase YuxK
MADNAPMRRSLNIIYDGQCPFCSAYVRRARLQAQADVTLTNAREVPALVAELAREGIDLDTGMVVTLDGARYHGAAAMHVLASLTTPVGVWNRMNAWLFGSTRRARIVYPWLRRGRGAVLWLLRRPRLNAHD